MPSINPKLFEPWNDPEGGEWIKIVSGKFDGVIWRPVDMDMNEDGKVNFRVETFEGPNSVAPPAEDSHDAKTFETVCGKCIKDILSSYAAPAQPEVQA